ncbi:MAG: type 4a pilus biogenesis protein PilO [Candidatus Nomurabacteria bacterium]
MAPIWTGQGSIWVPEMGGINSLRNIEAQYSDTFLKAKELSKQGNELSSQYKLINEETRRKMLLMVPLGIDKIRLLSEVYNIANQSDVALSDVSVNETTSPDKLKGSYDVSFSVKTTYTNFKKFMINYENSLRLFTLESVNFSAPEKIDEPVNFRVSLKTYYLK